jgi:hypothetical protein
VHQKQPGLDAALHRGRAAQGAAVGVTRGCAASRKPRHLPSQAVPPVMLPRRDAQRRPRRQTQPRGACTLAVVAKMLLDAGAPATDVDNLGFSVLHRAARAGHDPVVDMLLEARPAAPRPVPCSARRRPRPPGSACPPCRAAPRWRGRVSRGAGRAAGRG